MRMMASRAGRSMWARAASAALALSVAAPLAAQTSLTIYNDGRVLVRRQVPMDLPRGQSQHTLVTGPMDPGTLFPLDPGVSFVAGSYDAGVDQQSALRRAIGRRLVFRVGKDTSSAEVIGVDPERYKLPDGTISFQAPGIPEYPADLVTVDPGYTFTVTSSEARKSLGLGYFVQGGGWAASYQIVIAGETARMMGQAVVNGGPLRVRDAELQLLAGRVSVAEPARAGIAPRAQAMMVAKNAYEAEAPTEEKVGEFHLYTLPGRNSLEPGVTTSIGLFTPAAARVHKTFEVHGQIPYWGGLAQYGQEDDVPVNITYTIERPRKTDLGDRPLPGGVARLFEADSSGRLQLIGESAMPHSPAGEDLHLAAGVAFDLTAKRVQTGYSTRRDTLPGGLRTVATADYRVTLNNAGATPATVYVVEERGGEWNIVSSSVPPEKQSSTRTRFAVPVPANGRAVLTYRVRILW